jgi:hypothetical protein
MGPWEAPARANRERIAKSTRPPNPDGVDPTKACPHQDRNYLAASISSTCSHSWYAVAYTMEPKFPACGQSFCPRDRARGVDASRCLLLSCAGCKR